MIYDRELSKLLGFVLVIALLSTVWWLSEGATSEVASTNGVISVLVLALTIASTTANLGLRWFRWHFLLRRFDVLVPTRRSLLVFLATLPAILTPFYIGELLRSLAFTPQNPQLKGRRMAIWLIERGADAAVLGAFCLWRMGGALLAILALGIVALAFWRILAAVAGSHPTKTGVPKRTWWTIALLGSTTAAWVFPVIALWISVTTLAQKDMLPKDAFFVFGASSLVGGVTGAPGGIVVTGSAEILFLRSLVDPTAVPWIVAIFRLGTTWFSVILGVVVLLMNRSLVFARVRAGAQVQTHFDELAPEYELEIPDHTRAKLLEKKTGLMDGRLSALRSSPEEQLRGLDVGCGQGWYALALATQGHRMSGIDASKGQIARAKEHANARGLAFECCTGSATKLPFPNDSFDFAYSINVMHHILGDEDRRAAFGEIVRVLRPGGAFFLHEMNIRNPFFHLYMSYLFPLLNRIDEGNERWISDRSLPSVVGGTWQSDTEYFTFLPDFLPQPLTRLLLPLERWLEKTSWTRPYGAHFMATLVKDPASLPGEERPLAQGVNQTAHGLN